MVRVPTLMSFSLRRRARVREKVSLLVPSSAASSRLVPVSLMTPPGA